jgi:hypothetical protein
MLNHTRVPKSSVRTICREERRNRLEISLKPILDRKSLRIARKRDVGLKRKNATHKIV